MWIKTQAGFFNLSKSKPVFRNKIPKQEFENIKSALTGTDIFYDLTLNKKTQLIFQIFDDMVLAL